MSMPIRFPEMRLQAVAALRSLSDVRHQQARWGRVDEGVNYYEDFSLIVHVLYDDCAVLPEPEAAVGAIIHSAEVLAFAELELVLGPMLDELGDAADEVYGTDPRWPAVVRAAGQALLVMKRVDEGAAS
ncbi:MAG: hypothetical protein QM582_11665 [Micropruina sp.]|uniref:SCO4402 family protein n=1 Tax=Micropruina sp. TaxID=2737536 RepID=UPI0039E527EC